MVVAAGVSTSGVLGRARMRPLRTLPGYQEALASGLNRRPVYRGVSDAPQAPKPRRPPYGACPIDHALADYRTACISRAIDDREMALQKQSRVFFQISGAGHEALLLALARHLRPGYDWFFPYYRDLALVLGLGVSPTEVLLQAVGSADDPASGGRQMPAHWGAERQEHRHPVVLHRLAVPRTRSARRRRPATSRGDPACRAASPTATSSPTCRSARGPRPRASSGRASTRRAPSTCPCCSSWPTTATPSRCPQVDQSPAPDLRARVGLPRPAASTRSTAATTSRPTPPPHDAVAHVRAGTGPALVHATVTRPYSHSAADTQSKYRSAEELADEAAHDPILLLRTALVEAGVLTEERRRRHPRRGHGRGRRRRPRSPWRRRLPDPATVTDHVYVLPDVPRARRAVGRRRGGGVRRGHQAHPARGRWRPTSGSACSARTSPMPARPCSPTSRARAACSAPPTACSAVRAGPLLQHAAGRGQHRRAGRRAGHPGPAARARDPVLRLHLAGHAPDQERGGHHPLALQRCLHLPHGDPGPDRRLPHRRGDLAQPVRRVDLRPRARSAHRLPVRARDAAGLLRYAFQCEDPVHVPRAQAPAPPALHARPVPRADWVLPFGHGEVRRAGHDLTIVTWGATVQKSLEAAAAARDRKAPARSRSSTSAPSPRGTRTSSADSVQRTSRALVVHEDVLTCGFGAEVAAWIASEVLRAPRRTGAPGRGPRHARGLRAGPREGDPPPDRRHHRAQPATSSRTEP